MLTEGQTFGKIKVQHLAVAAGGDEELAEVRHALRRCARFLLQLTQRGLIGVLATLQFPCGNFLKHTGEDVAILLYGEHIVVFVKSDDGDTAGMLGDFAYARSAVWQEHVVAVDMQNFSLVDRLAGKLAFGQIHDKTAS